MGSTAESSRGLLGAREACQNFPAPTGGSCGLREALGPPLKTALLEMQRAPAHCWNHVINSGSRSLLRTTGRFSHDSLYSRKPLATSRQEPEVRSGAAKWRSEVAQRRAPWPLRRQRVAMSQRSMKVHQHGWRATLAMSDKSTPIFSTTHGGSLISDDLAANPFQAGRACLGYALGLLGGAHSADSTLIRHLS